MKELRVAGSILLLITLLSSLACEAGTPTNRPDTRAAATPSPSPINRATETNYLPLTLPVLDAFFVEESFNKQLTEKLELTDEQIQRLRSLAREETARLGETNGEDHSGTTSEAVSVAKTRIESVIGPDKTAQLAEFIGELWSEGHLTTADLKPNAIPEDSRIVINAPAYRMDVFTDGKLIQSYKIGIGYPEFPLPSGLRQAKEIIFNPTWTPPDEPWVGASRSISAGKTVPAGSKLNPLGLLKIPIGLPSLIHGGKSEKQLGGFASHGCVGLTNAQVQDFARLLAKIGGEELSEAEMKEYAKNRTQTKTVTLKEAVPVELRYETIVVEDGKLHIYRDVYDRGTNSEENLKRVLEVHGVSLDQLSDEERAQVTAALRAMARDATGKPVTEASPEPERKPQSARKTRTVKGQKEMVVEIAALKGKGYLAPVMSE